MNPLAILNILGALLCFTGLTLFLPIICALIYGDGGLFALLITSGICFGIGLPIWWICRKHRFLHSKDGFIIVTFGWLLLCLVSALPFVIDDAIPSYTDAFFEIMSGYTTTGATVLSDIEALPHSLLFWRSLTHFIGGMGIILMMIMVIPLLGIGGLQLYKAEGSPGQGPENAKLSPRLKESAKYLWIIYVTLTVVETLLLWLGGMSLFDSLCHAFGTIATAGFSPKDASVGHYQSAYIDWIITIFMFLGGVNFILHYRIIKGEWSLVGRNTELRWYVLITFFLCGLCAFSLWNNGFYPDFLDALRYGSFQVVSILTTTGFTTDNYELWPHQAQSIIFLLLFMGACAGSTTSGIKIVQFVILCKYLNTKMRRILQPLSVTSIRINGHQLAFDSIGTVLSFFIANIFYVVAGGLLMTFISELDFFSAFMSVIATLWNIGPSFGTLGPVENFGHVSEAGKWFLSFTMLIGRLDMFTVLVMLYPAFWRE